MTDKDPLDGIAALFACLAAGAILGLVVLYVIAYFTR